MRSAAATAVRRASSATTAPLRPVANLIGATPTDITALTSLLGAHNVLLPDHLGGSVAAYTTDWLQQHIGWTPAVLRPTTTQQVAAALSYCNDRRLGVVPQGGNTSLVGGATPHGELLLSLAAMRTIRSFDASSGIVVAEAGVILAALDDHVSARGWAAPLDLGARASCMIGGNVATNAGGLRYLRYGSLHGSVLGLEVVTPDGTVLDCLFTLRKDNVGYDVKQLFIGSEGTLGVITAVALQLTPRSSSEDVAVFSVRSFSAAVDLLALARAHLGEVLSAAEFLDAASVSLTRELHASAGAPSLPPFMSDAPFVVLFETRGCNAAHDRQKLDGFMSAALAAGMVLDGALAADGRQAARLWAVRDDATAALFRRGIVLKYDLSFGTTTMYDVVGAVRERLAALQQQQYNHDVVVTGFGHLADGNVHLNISLLGRDAAAGDALRLLIEPFIMEGTLARGGSISAEHGLGRATAAYLTAARPPGVVRLMRGIKELLDPVGIMNPTKVWE